jgi:hypothetical protein
MRARRRRAILGHGTSTESNPGGQIMVSYFYAWTPLVIVGAVVLLALPWLGLIALIIGSLVAVAALASVIVFVPYTLGRAISRRRHRRSGAGLVGSAAVSPHPARAVREPQAAPASRDALFVIPGRGGGLRASIRGHLLELAEPGPVHRLAPTPDDLFIASIASDLAWSARHFLHGHGLPDDVSVSAEWRRRENPPRLTDVSMTVTVPETAEALSNALEDTLAEQVAGRSLDDLTWPYSSHASRVATVVTASSPASPVT